MATDWSDFHSDTGLSTRSRHRFQSHFGGDASLYYWGRGTTPASGNGKADEKTVDFEEPRLQTGPDSGPPVSKSGRISSPLDDDLISEPMNETHINTQLRVNVARNGSRMGSGIAMTVGSRSTFDDFLFDAAHRLGLDPYKDDLVVWSEAGFQVMSADVIVPEETLFIGASHEEFRGFSSPSIVSRIWGWLKGPPKPRETHQWQAQRTPRVAPRKISAADLQSSLEVRLRIPEVCDDLTSELIPGVAPSDHPSDEPHFVRNPEPIDIEGRFWSDPDFDISTSHLMKIFATFDKTGKGVITYEQFGEGLKAVQLSVGRRDFQDLCQRIDVDKSGDIKASEFVRAIQDLAIQARFSPGTSAVTGSKLYSVFVYDYSDTAIRARCAAFVTPAEYEQSLHEKYPGDIKPDGVISVNIDPILNDMAAVQGEKPLPACERLDLESFLEEAPGPPAGMTVRWINIVGHHPYTLYRLAGIYGLHQLEVEDAMEINERTKLKSYADGRTQIVLRMVRGKKKPPLRLKDDQLSIFLINGNTVITVHQKRASELVTMRLQQRIAYKGSKLRLNNAHFLVYSIMDRMVDYTSTLIYQFNRQLVHVEKEVHSPSNTTPDIMMEVHRIRREMGMLRDWLRPTQVVVQKLAEMRPELDAYYHDILDHTTFMMERINYIHSWCQSLNDHYMNFQSHQMNSVIYFLTIVSSIFIPAQFLTGVYGMNFKYMPELEFRWSYPIFWVFTGLLIPCTILHIFRRRRWI